MATPLSTIKNWFRTGLKPTQLQFWATWDSFFHKDEKIPVSSVKDLTTYLNQKAEIEAFNNHLLDYEAHKNLLNNKVEKVEGFGLSETNYSAFEKDKLGKIDHWHYARPVNNLNALAAIPTEERFTKQRRYVHSQGCDYFFDGTITTAEAMDTDVAPNDQTNNVGYWRKGVNMPDLVDNLTSNSTSKAPTANQVRILKGLLDALDLKFADYLLLTEKGAAGGVAVLDSNGHIVESQLGDLAITDTITPTETSLTAFVANAGNYEFQRGDLIIIDDGAGNIKHYIFKSGDKSLEANYSQLNASKLPISAIIDLQSALDGKQPILGYVPTPNGGNTNDDAQSLRDSINENESKILGLESSKQSIEKAYKYFHQLSSAHDVKNIINNAGGSSSTYKTGGYFYIAMNQSGSHPSGMPSEFVYDSGNNNHVAILYLAGTGQPGTTAAHITDFAGNVYTIFGENTNGDSDWKKNSSKGTASRPTKNIPNTTQYTAVLEDKDKFLVFTNPIDFIIPSGIFSADDVIEARNKANGDVTVVDGSGMTVQVVSSQSKLAPQFAFFGLRFESASVCGLLGQLKPI